SDVAVRGTTGAGVWGVGSANAHVCRATRLWRRTPLSSARAATSLDTTPPGHCARCREPELLLGQARRTTPRLGRAPCLERGGPCSTAAAHGAGAAQVAAAHAWCWLTQHIC